MTAAESRWVGDPTLPWNILVAVDLDRPPTREVLLERLTGICRPLGWRQPGPEAVVESDTPSALLPRLAASTDPDLPVTIGRTPAGLVIRGQHRSVDGLGMLALVRDLAGVPVSAGARGVRPATVGTASVRALFDRLVEVTVRPQTVVTKSVIEPTVDDVFASTTIAGSPRTADLVLAGARAISHWNGSADRRHRTSVAVGVSTVGGAHLEVADHSGFLRLDRVERLSRQQIGDALTTAPLQVGGSRPGNDNPLVAAAVRTAVRLFSARLGSTLLVSHLGRVRAPGLASCAFYPVTGGGSGLSLGAVTVDDRTTLTMRARGRRHSTEGLERLLETLRAELS